MSNDAKTTHAIDYLEPWSENGYRVYARLEARPDDGYPDGGVLMEWGHFGGIGQYGTRAVACVNACAGIADPSDLRRQRDELFAAVQSLRVWVEQNANDTQFEMAGGVLSQAEAAVSGKIFAVHELTIAAIRALAYIEADGRDVIEEELLRDALNRIKGVLS